MKIVELQAENIKKLRAVSIKPNGAMVEITGRNGAGKSSILDAIWWALAGAKHIQSVPIRKGEDKARIRLDLGELIVERRFTDKGSTLNVENAEGARFPSPQKMLDDLLGALAFDPLAFVGKAPAEQFEMLRSALGLDFTAIEAGISERFDLRTGINRDAKADRSAADSIVIEGEVPSRPIDTGELAGRIGEAANHNADIRERAARREAAREKVAAIGAEAESLRQRADELDKQAGELVARLETAEALPSPIDVDDLRNQLAGAEAKNRAFDAYKRKSDLVARAEEREGRAAALTAEIERLRQSKAELIAAADMPVDGLDFGEGEVLLDGVPFEQASTAQQLRTSVGLAMAMNPKLQVLRIKEGSFLDEDNLRLIAEMAEERGYQIWIERVDSTGKVGIVIDDGEIKAVNERAA